MNNEELQRTLEAIAKGGIHVAGDLVLEKHVEHEIGNVQAGGIGIQIVGGRADTPMTASDKDIREALEELLRAKDEKGERVFRNKKQWWAVYRVLQTFCNYPMKMTSFAVKVKDLGLDCAEGATALTYDSLQAAPKEVPLMTCSPAAWDSLKDKSENYRQQYVVAEFLMLKLGIKS